MVVKVDITLLRDRQRLQSSSRWMRCLLSEQHLASLRRQELEVRCDGRDRVTLSCACLLVIAELIQLVGQWRSQLQSTHAADADRVFVTPRILGLAEAGMPARHRHPSAMLTSGSDGIASYGPCLDKHQARETDRLPTSKLREDQMQPSGD